jgi:oligopeptide/dipeptide ABC transporter ATP-binding protein
MYLGRIVEMAESDELFDNPLHPYTQALLSAVPVPDPAVEARRQFRPAKGEVPSPINPPSAACSIRAARWRSRAARSAARAARASARPLGRLQRGALARQEKSKRTVEEAMSVRTDGWTAGLACWRRWRSIRQWRSSPNAAAR